MEKSFDRHVHVGLHVSHFLVAHYLYDLLKHLNIDPNPTILSDNALAHKSLFDKGQVVIVTDLCGLLLPVCACFEAYDIFRDRCSFLALDRPKTAREIAPLLLSGFSGFVSHNDVPSVLGRAISVLARGQLWAPPEALGIYRKLTVSKVVNGIEVLTKRESQILELIRKRFSNAEIASILGIAQSTVKFHVSNIMEKQRVKGRKDLIDRTAYLQCSNCAIFPVEQQKSKPVV